MQRSDANAVQTATEKIVDDLLKLLDDNQLGHVWAAWHPHRFAAGEHVLLEYCNESGTVGVARRGADRRTGPRQ